MRRLRHDRAFSSRERLAKAARIAAWLVAVGTVSTRADEKPERAENPHEAPSGLAQVFRHAQTAPTHGFGGFGETNVFGQTANGDGEFIERIAKFEDADCRAQVDPRVRSFAYLELRDRLLSRGEAASLDKFLVFLNEAAASALGGGRAPAAESAVNFRDAVKQLPLIKVRQIEAQQDPDKAVQSCRARIVNAEATPFELSREIKALAKCRVEEDAACFERWTRICPSYRLELIESSNAVPAAKKCLGALNAVVAESK